MMINIAVVEDDHVMRRKICNLIQQEAEKSGIDMHILAYANANSLLQVLISGETFDILFCAIEMEGMNGIELGKIVRKRYPGIYMIYVTSHTKYAVESYILEAYQYVLKQDMEQRLPEVLNQLVSKVENRAKKYRIISTVQGQEKLLYTEIIYIGKEKGGKYVQYITTRGSYRERISVKDLMHQLRSREFMFVDRGYIVNLDHVWGIKGDTIFMTENHQVTVSKGRSAEVKEQLNSYWDSCG